MPQQKRKVLWLCNSLSVPHTQLILLPIQCSLSTMMKIRVIETIQLDSSSIHIMSTFVLFGLFEYTCLGGERFGLGVDTGCVETTPETTAFVSLDTIYGQVARVVM